MLPGTHLTPVPTLLARGTLRGPLGDITDAQRAADAAQQQALLAYAMDDLKGRRAEDAKARAEAAAQAEAQAAAARWERTQQQALDAATKAGEQAAYTQGAILATSSVNLKKVLVAVGLGVAASYLLFAKLWKKAPETPR